MFESRFLDFFSRVHPAIPAIVFVPVVVGGVWLGIDRGLAVGTSALLFLAGIAIWTLTEYWLHRLLFHWEPKFPGGDRLHFIIHGVHHDHPNDAMRLVMPPAVSIPARGDLPRPLRADLRGAAGLSRFGGFIVGYLAYDYTHYHVHHAVPKTRFGKRLRTHHMRHHFQDHRYGFGVSSPLWDAIMGTLPRRRKELHPGARAKGVATLRAASAAPPPEGEAVPRGPCRAALPPPAPRSRCRRPPSPFRRGSGRWPSRCAAAARSAAPPAARGETSGSFS